MKSLVILALAAFVSGCGVTIQSKSKPAYDTLSGTYRYVGLGSFRPSEFPNPLVEFENISQPGEIEITQDGLGFTARYKGKNGSPVSRTLDLSQKQKGIVWKNRQLVSTQRESVNDTPILPLPAMHHRGSRIFRDSEGNLVVVGFFKENGLFWTDYTEEEIILELKK